MYSTDIGCRPAPGCEMNLGMLHTKKRVMDSFGISAVTAPAIVAVKTQAFAPPSTGRSVMISGAQCGQAHCLRGSTASMVGRLTATICAAS
jgi:hypothetical protein